MVSIPVSVKPPGGYCWDIYVTQYSYWLAYLNLYRIQRSEHFEIGGPYWISGQCDHREGTFLGMLAVRIDVPFVSF